MLLILWGVLVLSQNSEAEIPTLLQNLESDQIDVREGAEKKLIEYGPRVVPQLNKITSFGSSEASARANKVLERIAEKLLSSVEGSFSSKKGLAIQFVFERLIQTDGVEKGAEVEGTLRIAPGNKFRLETTRVSGLSKAAERRIVADGKVLVVQAEESEMTVPLPGTFGKGVEALIVGAGLLTSLWCLPRPGTFVRDENSKPDPAVMALVGKAARAKPRRGSPSVRSGKEGLEISYKLIMDLDAPNDACDVVLTLNSATLLPQSRKIKYCLPDTKSPTFRATETYTLWREEDPPAGIFSIPSK